MPVVFENIVFELEFFSYIKMGLSLAKHLMSPQKMFSFLIFRSPVCAPLIPCHFLDDLDSSNILIHGEQKVLQS